MENVLSLVMLVFAALGAIDRIIGNKLGIGAEFERGFLVFGNLALSMIGMITLAPTFALWLEPVLPYFAKIGLDPSIVAGSLLANDMGGASLADAVCNDPTVGRWSGLVVGSMLGCTVSFTIPYALDLADRSIHREILIGFAAGIVTIPVGCFIGGLVGGVGILPLLINSVPLVLISLLVALLLVKKTELCVKIFAVLGKIMQIIITVGLALGMIAHVTGFELLPALAPIGEGALVCFRAVTVLAGAFPLVSILSRLLGKPLARLGALLGINGHSTLGFLSTLASSTATFPLMEKMDSRGIVMNSAFAVSASFLLADHLAFSLAHDSAFVFPMLAGKLSAAALAVIIAFVITKKKGASGEDTPTPCEIK